jgi:hypothetical protein
MLAFFAQTGSVGALRLLLDAGIEPNQARADGGTALLYAAAGGHLEAVRLLVARGADPTRANKAGVTPLSIAEHRKHQAVADYLRGMVGEVAEKSIEEAPPAEEKMLSSVDVSLWNTGMRIGNASRDGDWKTVRELIQSHPGALSQCLSVSNLGSSPHCEGVGVPFSSIVLTNAISSGAADAALMSQLLAAHADPNRRSSQGVSMVLLAVDRGNAIALDLLLKAGADPNAPSRDGLTPLQHAVLLGKTLLIERLLAAGARPSPDNKGNMPGYYLYWAHQGNAQLASRLGYAKAHEYEARKHEPDFDWNGFAQAMLQGAAQMTAQMQQQRQPVAAAPRPVASGPSLPDSAFFQPLKPAAPVQQASPQQQVQRMGTPQSNEKTDRYEVRYSGIGGYQFDTVRIAPAKSFTIPRVICGITVYDDSVPSESFHKALREASNPVVTVVKNGHQELARCSGR